MSGPKKSVKITYHFTCTASAYVVYCITSTFSKKLYTSETERRLGDRFREHPLEVERNDEDITTRHKLAKWEYVARSHN